jgi:hypothetical protein
MIKLSPDSVARPLLIAVSIETYLTRPFVGSASVKNWNESKKLAPWNESEREYVPANACGTRRGKRRRKSAKLFMDV